MKLATSIPARKDGTVIVRGFDGEKYVFTREAEGDALTADVPHEETVSFLLAGGMFTSHIHQKRKPRRPLPEHIARANTRRSKIRAQVEHVFAAQKHRMGLVVRTIGIARATIKIGMANLAYNMKRLIWLEGRTAPA